MQVNIKKLHSQAVIPTYAKDGDAGMDLTATSIIKDDEKVTYGTGLAVEIPAGYVGLLFPRSSVRKTDLSLSNCVGVIDSGFRAEVQATFTKLCGYESVKYEVGDRVAQLIIMPYPQIELIEVDELTDTERGAGGFGSTGN